jgi:hypothetical protein
MIALERNKWKDDYLNLEKRFKRFKIVKDNSKKIK